MKIRTFFQKFVIFMVLLLFMFVLSAAQVQEDNQWRVIFEYVIGIALMLLGAPLTQYLKIWLNLKDKAALLLTAVVATAIAIAELMLTNALGWESFSLENFPLAFSAVMTVATLYYQLLKGSDTVFGKRLLLPKNGPDHDVPG